MHVVDVGGWSLAAAARIDLEVAGFAGHFLRAGAERRHTLACQLAKWPNKFELPEDAAKIAREMMVSSNREIISAALGSCPIGFLGALAKGGTQPASPGYYARLHAILTDERPSRAAARRCIMQVPKLDEAALGVIVRLPNALRIPAVVEIISKPANAAEFSWLWRRLLQTGLPEKELLHSLRQSVRAGSLASFAGTWASRVPFPPHPVAATVSYAPLRDGRDLDTVARRFRNCAAELLPALLEGRRHLGVFTCSDAAEIILEMRPTDRGVILEDVHGHKNRTVSPQHRREALTFLKTAGVTPRFGLAPTSWRILHTLGACSLRWRMI